MSAAGQLELRGLGKDFGAVTALQALDLKLQPGAITTLLGPSGCGKTTALRLIAGFLEPDRGQVLLDGRSLAGLPPFRRDTAMVFQDFALFPHMSVEKNVSYGLQFRGVTGAAARRRVAEMLDFLQLDAMATRLPHELSGGQQQRVALGRALAVQPRVLLMDEPLSNLDARLRARLRSEIRAIQRELGVTTVFVTHDQQEALTLSDTIAVLNAGRLIQAGSPRELFELPGSRFVADVLGEANFLPVTETGPDTAVVLGQTVRVRRAAGSEPQSPQLLVRPDWLTRTEQGTGALHIRARLLSAEFHGTFERCLLQLTPLTEPLKFDLPAGAAASLEAGDQLELWLPSGRGVLVSG